VTAANKAYKDATKSEQALQAKARRQHIAEEKVQKAKGEAAQQATKQALQAEKEA
jgi:hypothetical protein